MKIVKISESFHMPPADIHDRRIFDFFSKAFGSGRLSWRAGGQEWLTYISHKIYHAERYYWGVMATGNAILTTTPSYALSINISSKSDHFATYDNAVVKLFFNGDQNKTMSNLQHIATWTFEGDEAVKNDCNVFLNNILGDDMIRLPHVSMEERINKKVRLTRSKSMPRGIEATAMEIFIRPKPKKGHSIFYVLTHLETTIQDPLRIIKEYTDDGRELTVEQSIEAFNQWIERAKNNGYVDETSDWYIKEGANPINYDFVLNKKRDVISPVVPSSSISKQKLEDLMNASKKTYKFAQNFEGYFTGNVPDYATQFLGTTAVEASQIEAMFGKASEAVNLVNQFNSSLLYNISFIFNFAKSGAYGVYLSELDRAIKTKALQKKLEQKGYRVVTTGQGLTAYPKEGAEITPEAIQQDIDNIYQDLQSKGGTAIGINMNAVLSASKQDAMESGSNDPEMWQWIAILHLGGTIVHEAVHAKGNMGEGPSEQSEQAFVQWAIPKINEQYKISMESQGKEYTPLMITNRQRHANSSTWYKTAQQLSYYLPHVFVETPLGSDIRGRFPVGSQSEMAMQPWSMLAQEDQRIPIESRLSRQYMSPLPPDLNQEDDIIEEQLRKYTRGNWKLDSKSSMEELLSDGWDEDRGYTTLEGLLDEKRPKPLMVPLQKKASKTIKTATLFGWMNNLSISDGNTIPGLGDRVMAWEDRDECFSREEEWIRQQPRYNPTYDIKGFYYRWIEPRYQPQLFDDMTRDYGNTHPAKRFASSIKMEPEIANILFVLAKAKSKIAKGHISTTRFIVTEDVMPLIDKIFVGDSFKINVFHYGVTDNQEDIFAVWISASNVSEESIEKAEKYLQNKSTEENIEGLIDNLTGLSKQRNHAIREIVDVVKDTCYSHEINGLSIVGSYPRDVAMKSPAYLIDSLEFRGGWADQCLKIGGLVAEKLGAQGVDLSHNNLSFVYNNVSVNFSGDSIPAEIKGGLQDQGIDVSSAHVDLFNRDFTINMLAYDMATGKITDPTQKASEDIDRKVIRTFFDPDYVCSQNPIIILRALKLKIRHGMEIDPLLQKAMMDNSGLIFDGRYSDRDLIIARENVKKEGKKKAEELFKTFGLEELEKVR